MRRIIGFLGGVLFFVVFTGILVEGMYRYYLSGVVASDIAKAFTPSPKPSFSAYGVAPWRFDRQQGFVFDQRPWLAANIKEGAFDSCGVGGKGNRLGNVDHADDDSDADLRLMIVGSSYSMVGDEKGHLVNEVLMERLSRRLGKKVFISNFSRDSTGVLTYVDTARYKLREMRPAAVVMLVNVAALIYQRHWRTVLPEDGGFRRFYISLDPVEQPTDPSRAIAQPQVINDNITNQWCEMLSAAKARGDTKTTVKDPLVEALVTRHQQRQRAMVVPHVLVDFWRPDASFVLNMLLTGNPFYEMSLFGEQPVYSPLSIDHYTDDPTFNESVDYLKASGIPVIAVHIPTLPEMENHPNGGFEFSAHGVPPQRGASLAASLEQALGQPFEHLFRYYPSELKREPLQLVYSAENSHPNPVGVHAMAEALEELLTQHPQIGPLLSSRN
jgi:hypothetical protein